MVFQNKVCLGSPIEVQHGGGLPKTLESTIGEEWSPSPLSSVPVSDQESPKGVASVWASPWGLSHSREPV